MDNNDKKLLSDILRIAFPSIIDNLLLVTVGLIDALMVSKLGSAAIASIGLVNQPRWFIFSAFFAMQTCISIIVARKVGENNKHEGNEIFLVGLVYTILLSLAVGLLFYIYANPFMVFCGANSDTFKNSVAYFRIIMLGLVFNAFYTYINAVERGCGNTKLTLKTNLVSHTVNIILNYLLIEGKYGFPRLEVRGAAIATVCGFIFASAFAFINLLNKDRFISIAYIVSNKIKISKDSIVLVVRNWWSIFADLFLTRVGFLMQSIIAARMGTLDYAVNHIGILSLNLAFSFGDGLSVAAVSLVGSSIGAKDIGLAKKYAKLAKKAGLFIALFISGVLLVFGRTFFDIFFDDVYSLGIARVVAMFLVVIIPIAIYKIVLIGIIRSGGDNKYIMRVSIATNTILQPIMEFLLIIVAKTGILGAWIGIFTSQFIGMITVLSRYKSEKWIQINL